MRVVLDTNIVMDMLHFADRHTHPLRPLLSSGQWRCFTDASCLAELERVTGYPAFELDSAARANLIDSYREFVQVCEASGDEDFALPSCRDPDDQKFLVLAARCRADLLITRDKLLLRLARHRHKPAPFAILTAEAATRLIEPAAKDPARSI